jgi:hypothetical protein
MLALSMSAKGDLALAGQSTRQGASKAWHQRRPYPKAAIPWPESELMSTEISELVRSLHNSLSSALPHINIADGERAKGATAMAEAATREFAGLMQRLALVRAKVAEAEQDLRSKRHLINDEAARALLETNWEIAAAQEELGALRQELADTQKLKKGNER